MKISINKKTLFGIGALLFAIMIFAGILTQVLPTGKYDTDIEGHIINGTYTQIGNNQLTIYNQDGSMEVHHYSVSYEPNGGTFETEQQTHNYGYGKAEYVFSFLISIAMILVSIKFNVCFPAPIRVKRSSITALSFV